MALLITVGVAAFVAGFAVGYITGVSISLSELEKLKVQVELFKQALPRLIKNQS
jgi:F0F1-type ATP synthase membrane subunit c/vacuolar-type H+-ATPase subunit K